MPNSSKPLPPSTNRWYPTTEQLSDKVKLERAFRQVLTQHYDLVDRYNALAAQVNADPPAASPNDPPPGSGPTDSLLLGLRVQPVDTQTLADGAKLTYVQASGNLQFK